MFQYLKSLVKDSAIYALGNLSAKLVGFILLPFYVDKLSVAEYGMLGALEASFQLIVALAGMNLYVAFIRWYSDEEMKGRQKSTFFTLLSVISLIAVVVNLIAFPFSSGISRLLFDSGDYSRVIRLMLCSAGLELIGTIPATLCRVQLRPVQYTRNIIIRLSTVLIFTILFLVALGRKLEGIYEAQIIGGIVYNALFIPYIIKNVVAKFEKKILIKMYIFSLPLFLSSFFGILLGVADRFSLNFITGLASAGIYLLGFKLGNIIKTIFVQPVSMAVFPMIFRISEKPNAQDFYARLTTYLTFGLLLPVIAISVFGQEAVKILAIGNSEYWGAYIVIPFIAFGALFGMMKDQAIYSLHIVKRTGVIATVVIFVSLLNIGLNILLISFFGAIGAGLATLLSQIVYFGITLRYAQRYYPVPYEYRKLFISIGLGALICFFAFIIRDWSLTWRLCIKSLLLTCYPLILYFMKFFDAEELQALRKFWQERGF